MRVLHRLPRPVLLVGGALLVAVGAVLAPRPVPSLTVLVGILTLGVRPRAAVEVLVVVAPLALVVVGGFVFVEGVRGRSGSVVTRPARLFAGGGGVLLGAVALRWPDLALLGIAVGFGLVLVAVGLAALVAAVRRPIAGRITRTVVTAGAFGVLALGVALAGISVRLHQGEPTIPAFYDTPADVPAEPGRLLRSEPYGDVPAGAVGWRILYTTTLADGVPAVASGVVVVPADVDGPRPVVAWAHGSTGVDRTCAPSLLDDGLETGAFFLGPDVADRGWALVATDYIGLGAEGVHPYLVGDPSGRAVLDAVRAAHQLDGADLDDPTVVWGHSQGGGAALWTGQIAPAYAPDLDVRGVAALAPAADVAGLVDAVAEVRGTSVFAAFVVTGYAEVYDDVHLADLVDPVAGPFVTETAGRCLAEPQILLSVLTALATGMTVYDGDLTTGPLAGRLAENEPRGPFAMPVLVAQGGDDQLIRPEVQAAYVERLCDAGTDVDLRVHPGLDHVPLVEAESPLVPELLAWTAARFAGDATETGGTCG